jgi:hypothetical protein
MTYQRDFTFPTELLEQIATDGFDFAVHRCPHSKWTGADSPRSTPTQANNLAQLPFHNTTI